MHRRTFLVTLGSLALAPMFGSCQASDRSMLRVLVLKNSLPPQLVSGFIKSIESSYQVELVGEGQFQEILAQLQRWYKTGVAEAKGFKVPLVPAAKSSAYIPNLVSMGDAWLPMAIKAKTIEPIDIQKLTNWGKLESRWHELAMRDTSGNLDPKGQVWGVPYRWGTTVIIYRRDRLAAAQVAIPQDWEDLWNPKLKQRISVLDRSREVIGLTLKKLGYSYNYTDLSQVANLKSELQKLHQQVKFYSAEDYLQPLIMGDTWMAVGWSSDAIDLIQKNPNIGAIVPRSGTAIWADLWVQPNIKDRSELANRSKLTQQWIDYSLQPQASNQISLFTTGTAPLLTSLNATEILPDIQRNPLTLPSKTSLDRSEFIYPLDPVDRSKFDTLWREIRQESQLRSLATLE